MTVLPKHSWQIQYAICAQEDTQDRALKDNFADSKWTQSPFIYAIST